MQRSHGREHRCSSFHWSSLLFIQITFQHPDVTSLPAKMITYDKGKGEEDEAEVEDRKDAHGNTITAKREYRRKNNKNRFVDLEVGREKERGRGGGGVRSRETLAPSSRSSTLCCCFPPHQFEPGVVASRIGRGVRRGRSGRQCARDPATRRWL